MMLPPDSLGDRYHVEFYGDDIAWLRVDPADGKIYAINPEFGVFGVAKDTNEVTNPTALGSVAPGTRALFTNVAYNDDTQEVWWEGRTPKPPADVTGWRDWTGELIARALGRRGGRALGAPEQPVHHDAGQRAQHRGGLREPQGRADRRDHLRRPHPRPRAADPRDHRPGRGRLRRAHPRRRGHVRGRGRRRPAALRPDVDAAVHVLPRGRVRGALAQDHRRRDRAADLRARQLVPARPGRTATSSGPATATTCARCCG